MDENHDLLRPLLNPSTTSAAASATVSPPLDGNALNNLKLISTNSGIIFRLSLVVFIGLVSIWANHEASKGYAITIVNESGHTFAGRRFQLFYASNDEAIRIVIKASRIIENLLYPDYDSPNKKPITLIIIRLINRNSTENIIVESSADHEFVFNISPSVMESTNFDQDVILTLRRGVARIWLWDGQGKAPKTLIDGIVEYLVNFLNNSSTVRRGSATACWDSRDPNTVAEFLNDCERGRPGFIRRLNQAMKDGWDDKKLGGALGLPVRNQCTTYESAARYNSLSE